MANGEVTLVIKSDRLIEDIRKDVEKMTIDNALAIVKKFCICRTCKSWDKENAVFGYYGDKSKCNNVKAVLYFGKREFEHDHQCIHWQPREDHTEAT